MWSDDDVIYNLISLQCENGRSVDEAENDIIMYNDVQQANPNAYPLYIKEGQRYVWHCEGVSMSPRVSTGSTR